MSDHEETSSIESETGCTLSELKSSVNKQLVIGQADKTNENSEHSNREFNENKEKAGKNDSFENMVEKSETSNSKTPEEGIESAEALCSFSLEKKSLQNNTGKVDFNQHCLDNKEGEQEHFESIQPENSDFEIKSTELEKSKEKTEEQLGEINKLYQDSLAKIVELEGRCSENNAKNVQLTQDVLLLSKNLQIAKEKNELILNEKKKISQKYEEIKEKNQSDNINHANMYRSYERKIEEMKAENKQIKNETVNLNRMLQNKEENVNQEINLLKIQLTKSQEENKIMSQELSEKSKTLENSQLEYKNKQNEFELEIQRLFNELENKTKLKNPEEKVSKEYHEELLEISEMKSIDKDLECINNEMKDEIEEYKSNICSKFNENNLLTRISVDLSNKIKNLELSISNTLEKFYKNSENDFQINFSEILIIKNNLELLNKIDSIEFDISNIDEIDSSSNLAEIQNFIDSIELLNQNLRVEIIETHSDLKLSPGKCIAVIEEIDEENLDKLSNFFKENRILVKNLLNEKNLLKKKFVELKKSIIEKEKPEPRI